MPVEKTITITCDKCGETHYTGPENKRPSHIHVTWWFGAEPNWDLESLCKRCTKEFTKMLNEWVQPTVEPESLDYEPVKDRRPAWKVPDDHK